MIAHNARDAYQAVWRVSRGLSVAGFMGQHDWWLRGGFFGLPKLAQLHPLQGPHTGITRFGGSLPCSRTVQAVTHCDHKLYSVAPVLRNTLISEGSIDTPAARPAASQHPCLLEVQRATEVRCSSYRVEQTTRDKHHSLRKDM